MGLLPRHAELGFWNDGCGDVRGFLDSRLLWVLFCGMVRVLFCSNVFLEWKNLFELGLWSWFRVDSLLPTLAVLGAGCCRSSPIFILGFLPWGIKRIGTGLDLASSDLGHDNELPLPLQLK